MVKQNKDNVFSCDLFHMFAIIRIAMTQKYIMRCDMHYFFTELH